MPRVTKKQTTVKVINEAPKTAKTMKTAKIVKIAKTKVASETAKTKAVKTPKASSKVAASMTLAKAMKGYSGHQHDVKAYEKLLAYMQFQDRTSELAALLLDDFSLTFSSWFQAAWQGKLDLVKEFVKAGMDVNSSKDHVGSAIMGAVEYDHEEVVKYLLANGSCLECGHSFSRNALSIAIFKQNKSTTRLLLEHGAVVTSGHMLSAMEHNWKDIVDLMIVHGADMKLFGNDILFHGVENPALIKWALELGTVPSARNLLKAIEDKTTVLLQDYLNHGGDANGNLVDPFGNKESLLMRAAVKGKTGAVKLLLEHGADRNVEDFEGNTALNYAKTSAIAKLIREFSFTDYVLK